ncbi:tripartite tricarboxylate transporter TctB family protein [Fulvimarina sp. 2208YS6-2-32]|uniref:Tripartite tricarboxylate transporter TctB family protein n=1 Tax=Fulvimarina uroteuthidis TaxID=3098149 RepID=A0ABU5I0T4_9HYPH|nr:tripartite tricarboxylate transporter TctB family protein [Fulvimarina sp. 2208YS6-2-32]MDY8108732.1 tripartite tricarboxylate transporter TctB family protein [Fulvimarina sp. 2208YS6-2-32]
MHSDGYKTADLWSGLFWIVLGGAIIANTASMPIPYNLGATFLTGPGFVPGVLGAGLMLLGVILSLRSRKANAKNPEDSEQRLSTWRPFAALVLMFVYASFLAFRQPFLPATIVFVALFVIVFNWQDRDTAARLKLLVGASVLGIATGFVVEFIFETLFYVRLP